uniref:Uncharacterized protein n=1 Tax=Manihot esculenta TaxID=3983 RepID=A0A2C9WK09_MANES
MAGQSFISWPTPFKSNTSERLKFLRCFSGPMPLNIRIWGQPNAPADKITSPQEFKLSGWLSIIGRQHMSIKRSNINLFFFECHVRISLLTIAMENDAPYSCSQQNCDIFWIPSTQKIS